MKICILTRTPNSYTEKRLIEEAKARDHEISCVSPKDCVIAIEGHDASVKYLGEEIKVDAVIPRIPKRLSSYDRSVLRQLETDEIYVLAKSLAIERSFDTIRTLQLIRKNEVSIQKTIIGKFDTNPELALRDFSAPVAIRSTSNDSDMVATSHEKTARSLIRAFSSDTSFTIIQKVPSSGHRRDITGLVLGSSIIASIRKMSDGEYSSIKLNDETAKVIGKIARALGLTFCAVELIMYDGEYVVSKIDISPSIEPMEKTTNRNVAGKIIEYIEQNARRGQKKDKIGA
ncbi:hypothetical protein FWC31_02175 [Candidatus Saccharibacteria bacterium]|nr:hypothetical protein [Candidatus Saccharibacteria bacterium]